MDNGTNTQFDIFSSRLVTFVYPVIVAFGLIGNALSVLAIANRHCKQSSFSVCVAALSIADTVSLISISVQAWPKYAFGVNVADSGRVLCKLIVFLSYFSGTISTWLVAAMTIERLLVTYYPYKATRWFSPKTGGILVAVIVGVLAGLYGHLLYGNDLKTIQNVTVCAFTEISYNTFFLFYFLWVDFVAYFCLPFLAIIICNTAILVG